MRSDWQKPTQDFWREWKENRWAMIDRGFTIKKIKNVWYMRNRRDVVKPQAELVFEIDEDGLIADDPHSQYPGVDMSVSPWIA